MQQSNITVWTCGVELAFESQIPTSLQFQHCGLELALECGITTSLKVSALWQLLVTAVCSSTPEAAILSQDMSWACRSYCQLGPTRALNKLLEAGIARGCKAPCRHQAACYWYAPSVMQ